MILIQKIERWDFTQVINCYNILKVEFLKKAYT